MTTEELIAQLSDGVASPSVILEAADRLKELSEENAAQGEAILAALRYMKSVRREAYAIAVRTMQSEFKRTVSGLCKGDVSDLHRMIDQVADEQLGVTE